MFVTRRTDGPRLLCSLGTKQLPSPRLWRSRFGGYAKVRLVAVADGIDTATANSELAFTMKTAIASLYLRRHALSTESKTFRMGT